MARSCLLTSCVLMVTIAIAASSGSGGVCVNFTANDYTVDEGANVNVPIEISGDFTGMITVNIVAEADTAAEGDFMFTPETVIFTPTDVATLSVTVSAVDDMMIENPETFTLQLLATGMGVDVTVGEPATVTITDGTTERVRIGFDQTTLIVEEGADASSSSLVVSVMTGGATLEREVTVTVMSADGTAMVSDDDYDMVSMDLLFSDTDSSDTVTVVTEVDMSVENDETFTLTLTAGDSSLVELIDALATVTITDTTALVVELDRSEYSLTEGGSGMMATVSLMAGLSLQRDVELTVETTDDTATDGDDYMSLPGTITLATGTTSQQLGLMALPDSIVEDIELFSFTVDSAVTATVSIMDNTMVTIGFDSDQYSVTEGQSVAVTVSVTSSGITLDRDVTVTVVGVSGEVTVEPEDITFTSDTLSHTVTVTALHDMVSGAMDVDISLTEDDPAVQLNLESATLTISDATVVIEVSEEPYTTPEGGVVSVSVLATNPADRTVTVDVVGVDNTAMGGLDFNETPLQLLITPENTAYTIPVTINHDSVVEVDEMFSVVLSTDEEGVRIEPNTAEITITDATFAVGLGGPLTVAEGEMAIVVVNVNSNPADRTLTVTLMTVNGTAEGGMDYTEVMTQHLITPDNTSFTVSVMINVDNIDEVDEMFSFLLTTDEEGVDRDPDTTEITITDTTILVTLDSEYSVAEGDSVTATIMTTDSISAPFTVTMTVPSQENITVEPTTFNFTSSATTHNFTITALKDDEVEEDQSVVLSATTDAVNVAIQSNMPTVIVEDRTILLRESPKSQGVLLGDEATLTCSFEAGYFVTVEWMRDDDILRDQGDMTSPTGGGLGIYSSVLMISDAMFTDCGSYRCFASGADTVYSEPAELSVVELMGPSTEMVTASVGAVDMLSCTIRHCGSFSINWTISNDTGTVLPLPIEVTNSTVDDVGSTESDLTDLIDLTSVVTIDTVGLVNENESQVCYVVYEDEGEIEDFAFKMFDYVLENVEVNVTVSPDRPSGNFHEGDTVVLTCTATNPPNVNRPLNFRWVQRAQFPDRFGRVITNDTAPSVTVITGPDYSILTFTNIQDDSDQTEDSLEGYYLCRVTNRERNDWVTVRVPVNVISGPTVNFPSPRVTVVNVGDNLTVTCDATSRDNPDITSITILLGAVVVASSNTSEMLSYTIVNPQLSDNGTVYLCSAVNALGTTNATFSLTVRDRPDVIDSETVSSTLLSLLVANLSWTAPNANNAPITEYTVSISSVPDGSSTMTPSPPTATYMLLQVDPEVEYNVTITATNVVDTSDPSDLVIIMGAMRDNATTTLINVLTTDAHIVLEWFPPPLSEPLEGDLPSNSEFSIDKYILLKDDKTIVTLDSTMTNYIYTVEDDEGETYFRIRTNYSDALINGLNPETNITVDIPTAEEYVEMIPESAKKPPVVPTTQPNGFTITWNEPVLLQNQDLLRRYEVFIGVSEDGRRRRQSMMPIATIDDTNMRSYTFTDGQPFTNYDVRVDGVVELNGENASVVALISTPVRTAEGVPSIPLSLQVGDIGITEVTVTWEEPASPNGIIIHYQVDVVENGVVRVREIVRVPETMVTVTGLVGNTDYIVSVRAGNGGVELGVPAERMFKTAPGVVTPTLIVNTNLDTERYSLTIDQFSTLHGPLSHYVIYVVESDDPPDTSAITGTNRIALAFLASESPAQVVMGDGETDTFVVPNDGGSIPYNNRELDAGTIYFFFIRLYSSVDVTVFNDSTPRRPSAIIPRDDTTEDNTVAIIAGVLGGLAFVIIIIIFLILVFVAMKKRQEKVAYKLNLDEKEDIDIYETIPELPSFPLETIHLTAAKNLTQESITTEDNPSYATHSTGRCNPVLTDCPTPDVRDEKYQNVGDYQIPVLTDEQMDITTEDNPSYATRSTESCNPVLTDCPTPDVRDEGYQNIGDYEIPVLTDEQMDITTEDNPSYTTRSTESCNPVLTDCPTPDVRDEGYQNIGDYEIPEIP